MRKDEELYSKLGVSAKKEEVHKVVENLDKGLYPGAFCKIVKDIMDREEYCSIFHSDGAGTKASLAYMYYKETGDITVFKGIVQDAIAMNFDDILCIGVPDRVFLSNTIDRNSKFISGEILSVIIHEYERYSKKLSSMGLPIISCGGETADVGDLVKTLTVNASMFTTIKRKNVINALNIKDSDLIVGLASFGKAKYEEKYNSGIGSNGLTLARHGTLSHKYYKKYPECYDQNLDENIVFFGNYELLDSLNGTDLTIGEALLSPTRTYTPVIKEILIKNQGKIHGIIHNTGGGQTKVLNFGRGIRYIKNDLFYIPEIFTIIQKSSNTSWREMFQVFNMGHRMELMCDEEIAHKIIDIAKGFDIDAKIIGYCETSKNNKNEIEINSKVGRFVYS
ncbi:MAG: phosphoribosylformylglycinamidine cyclo-ligase [Promethearchaeota archaeon]|nr:MAG: phosphoribosylformylglycinamidine cyclo-ligase [Candidatus Lokiarchaeota archaeon]